MKYLDQISSSSSQKPVIAHVKNEEIKDTVT